MKGEADRLRELIIKRTGLHPSELVCPREQSDMTPCVARDGDSAMNDRGTCVGCNSSVAGLINLELQRGGDA